MGLAASQARLLTITARKADCEFQSMMLSHEKIALSRDMEKISDEYQNAMNQTKLVYDYYGSNTSQMNLTYSLLMNPSSYNDYYPKLVTDNKNRVVLSDKYAQAAKKAGIPAEGYNGTPSSEVRNKFVEALRDNGTITAMTAANIESVSYNNAIGLGATISATETTQDVSYAELLEMIKANCEDTKDYGVRLQWDPTADGETDWNTWRTKMHESGAYPDPMLLSWSDVKDAATVIKDGDKNAATTSISLYDLLSDKHQYTYWSQSGGTNYALGEAAFLQQVIGGTENSTSFLNWMTDQFSSILGGTTKNNLALQYAQNAVYDIIFADGSYEKVAEMAANDEYGKKNSNKLGDYQKEKEKSMHCISLMNNFGTKVGGYEGSDQNTIDNAETFIGMVYNANGKMHDGQNGSKKEVAISLNNLAKVFLTAYVEYQEGIDHSNYSYEKGQVVDPNKTSVSKGAIQASLYKPQDTDIFQIKAPTDVDTGNSSLEAGFYDALFNIICMHGWTENDDITNADYMQELMKSGAVYISSINNDGNYYQSSYSTDTYISEISDTEGVAQAEAKYNAAKAKIENKENTIDTKMKNLDTEINSLTTEYDTMKNVINKSIEKAFKRYDA